MTRNILFVATATMTCTIYGDPHYYTYDGDRLDYQGDCRYLASSYCGNNTDTANFSVIIKQEYRPGNIWSERVTFIQYVDVVIDGWTARLLKDGVFEVYGVRAYAPYSFTFNDTDTTVTIEQKSDGSVLVTTSFGLEVWYEGNWHSTVTVSQNAYGGQVCK